MDLVLIDVETRFSLLDLFDYYDVLILRDFTKSEAK